MKIISALFLGLLLFVSQNAFALDENKDYNFDKEFNFEENSYYITDEQLQDAKEIDEISPKTDLRTKIINSGHFTSDTATKTYIPINKIQK